MARIELAPGEAFEHIHPGPSTTQLVEGELELEVNGHTVRLTELPVEIPPMTVHVLRNVGRVTAVAHCMHAPPPRQVAR